MRRPVAGSLRWKVMLLVLGTTFAALSLSAIGLLLIDLRAYERSWSNDLNLQAEIVARAAAPALSFNDAKTAEGFLGLMRVRPRVLAAAIYSRDGRLFATYVKDGIAPRPFPPVAGQPGYAIEGEELLLYRPIFENRELLGTVFVRASYQPWERLRDYLAILGFVMAVSLAFAALMSGWLQSAITQPILEVANVARDVMETRDMSKRVRKTTEDEIGELVDAFNAMLAEAGRRAEALREADRRKDEFLATLAHELRNPLAPLRNALEILRVAGSDPATAQKAREMMERQLGQMVRLVDDLLDVSRITTGKLAVRKNVVELQAVVRSAVETTRPFIESQRHLFEQRVDPRPIHVEADATRLSQVFSNLLHNAAKYTEPGGRIELSARREGDEAVVSVRDNGLGIDPGMREAIFDMFVQADRSLERVQAGLGVGLTLARRLVDLHGGKLTVDSEGSGKGSVFTVRIPVARGMADTASNAPEQSSRAQPRRILLADDNLDFVSSLALLLSNQGHDVRVAYDGAQALEISEQFTPDIAFLDIGMPKVHGYDVARRLRERPATSRSLLVAVTGWGQEADRRRAEEAGFDRHLVKPVEPEAIESILRIGA